MAWMSPNMQMETKGGGLGKGKEKGDMSGKRRKFPADSEAKSGPGWVRS